MLQPSNTIPKYLPQRNEDLWTVALQAPQSMGFSTRVLEWVAILFSRVSSPPKDRTLGLLHYRQILYH